MFTKWICRQRKGKTIVRDGFILLGAVLQTLTQENMPMLCSEIDAIKLLP